jgi:hypothetical protein
MRRILPLIWISLALITLLAPVVARAAGPAVLFIEWGDPAYPRWVDYPFFNELHAHGLALDVVYAQQTPITWDLLKQYNCVVLPNAPLPEGVKGDNYGSFSGPPAREVFLPLLDRYLAAGGGVFMLPTLAATNTSYPNLEYYLEHWGAKAPLEVISDPNAKPHPRNNMKFMYTDNVTASPVTTGVKGLWFPISDVWYNWESLGQPIEVSGDWTVVVRGSNTSWSEPDKPRYALETTKQFEFFARPGKTPTPPLFAIRAVGEGRMAFGMIYGIFHFFGGNSWIHDGVFLNKGIDDRPSDGGVLLENTLRWLSEPSLASGKLGGWVQDPKQLVGPMHRKAPAEFHALMDTFQNGTPAAPVWRGLLGARSSYSGGQGTAAQYAEAARRAGIDFVVFLEPLAKITESDYRKLEADCRQFSDEKVLLIPGLRFANNIGNPMFAYGQGLTWFTPTQLTGPDKDQLRLQCFDDKGELTYSDEDAKNWLWANIGGAHNVGYYDFSNNPGIPIRNLRLFGILGVMTYRDGKLVEDRTAEYLDYVQDGIPPLAGAVDLVDSPAGLEAAVAAGHYLTHAAAPTLADVPLAMYYGHQYGRANVYPSNGPGIKSWAVTQRVMTYAGESFVPEREVMRPLLWVTSEVGLKEITILGEGKVIRRFLPGGAKEFKEQFQWGYDRARVLVVEATDIEGGRAVSAAYQTWNDSNIVGWCGDRQNGEIWHGPATFPGPRRPSFATGPTWDGGPVAYLGAQENVHPAIQVQEAGKPVVDGYWPGVGGRLLEGNMTYTCMDESVANVSILAQNDYAPGVVANAYHTLGPIHPAPYLNFYLRRTQYIQRIADVDDVMPQVPKGAGGNLALMEGTLTLPQAAEVQGAFVMEVAPGGFQKNTANFPLWAIRPSSTGPVAAGLTASYAATPGLPPLGLLEPGGYVALVPSANGNTGVVFNVGREPLKLAPNPQGTGAWQLLLADAPGKQPAGKQWDYRLLVLHDALDEPALNLLRVEALRRYLGLTGENGCGLQVKQGRVLSQFGLQDLSAVNGIVAFSVPNPGWKVDVPLGMRFTGFNPNWTVGEVQISGYSPGFYTQGRNVYRNLAADDRGWVHLAVFPDYAPTTQIVVGHPIQCDNKDLIIEFAQLSREPLAFRVAVNNPTDKPIGTTLRQSMAVPGFVMKDTTVEVPAGGYRVVRGR